MRVVVTGANGFIGTAVCRALHGTGAELVACQRSVRGAAAAPWRIVDVGDIDGDTRWNSVLETDDIVVHLAARAHQRDDATAKAMYQRINVDGTRALALAARKANVRRFVFMSSIKVNGEVSPYAANGERLRFSARDTPSPSTLYGHSKWAAEQILQQVFGDKGEQLSILRPPLVYGVGQKGNLRQMMRAIERGWPLPLAGCSEPRSLISVENLAAAVVATIKSERGNGTFTLADCDRSSADIARAMAMVLDRPARLFAIPRWGDAVLKKYSAYRTAMAKLAQPLLVESEELRRNTDWCGDDQFAATMRAVVADTAAAASQ